MTTQMSTNLSGGLDGRPPTTQITTPQTQETTVSYFDEGPGFIYVRYLAKGGEGWSTPSTTELHGWFRYQADSVTEPVDEWDSEVFYVTYWTYCNSGNLSQCKRAYRAANCTFPEKWAGQWLASLLKTLLELQRNGVAHNDTHGANMFIHRRSPTADPEIILGDFGVCDTISDDSGSLELQYWADVARSDYGGVIFEMETLVHAHKKLQGFLDNTPDITNYLQEEVSILEARTNRGEKVDFRKPITNFNEKIESMIDKIVAYVDSLSDPPPEQDLIQATELDQGDDQHASLKQDFIDKVWKHTTWNGEEVKVLAKLTNTKEDKKKMTFTCKEGEWFNKARSSENFGSKL